MLGTLVVALLASAILPAAAQPSNPDPPKRTVSLTLIPPSPVSDRISLDVRGAVWNHGDAARTFEVSFYLDEERPERLLRREKLEVPPGEARGAAFRWPTAGKQGKHRIVLVAASGNSWRAAQPIEVLATGMRSTQRLGGAWVDLYHHDEHEGKPFNAELGKMTDPQWRELVRAMHAVDQNILVITMMFQNFTHRGRHKIESEGYRGRAYYPSRNFPGRMPIASQDPLEAILSEADRLNMQVMPGVGCYAFFDYTPGALAWCKKVSDELWERYGRHPSFYGWYVSAEKDGGLGSDEERREIVEFFREFTAHAHRLAPDKPVMLAPNCYHLRGAEESYRKLLPNLDIICPFGYHRMPGGDIKGEEAAALMQSLCDEAGCHLWMDLESFVFPDGRLFPRPIGGLVSDFTRFPNFEKTLHYQFPGLMSSPAMSRRPGGPASVKLYEDYARYLREGPPKPLVSLAAGRPIRLASPPDSRYPGRGAAGLVDGRIASEDYRDPQWMGWFGDDAEAVIDLGTPTDVTSVGIRCLQFAEAGIYVPKELRVAVSNDGKTFVEVGKARPGLAQDAPGPEISTPMAERLGARGRWVQVRAVNIGEIPPRQPAAGTKAWLFVDEVLVNPK
jgi:hypothetical protein